MLCNRFMINGEFFPWLGLETPLSNDTAMEWSSLASVFGLGYQRPLLDFALVVLKHIVDANESAGALEGPDRMHQLYCYLQSKAGESPDPERCREQIRLVFSAIPDSNVAHLMQSQSRIRITKLRLCPQYRRWRGQMGHLEGMCLVRTCQTDLHARSSDIVSGCDLSHTRPTLTSRDFLCEDPKNRF